MFNDTSLLKILRNFRGIRKHNIIRQDDRAHVLNLSDEENDNDSGDEEFTEEVIPLAIFPHENNFSRKKQFENTELSQGMATDFLRIQIKELEEYVKYAICSKLFRQQYGVRIIE